MYHRFSTLLIALSFLLFTQCTKEKTNTQASLSQEISTLISNKKATVAVSVIGIENDFTFNNPNAHQHMPLMSVFKFHLALAVLHQVDEGQLKLDQKIFISKAALLPNTWSPIREKYPDGNIEMPLAEIIKYTVASSDNNGADILLKLIGGPSKVQAFLAEKGISGFQIKYNEAQMHETPQLVYDNYATTTSVAQLLKAFYQEKIVSPSATRFLLQIMLQTNTGMEKLPGLLPKVEMARKTGSSGRNDKGLVAAENDCGIVTLPNGKHYAIAIFVKNSEESDKVNYEIIAKVSKVVYEHLSTLKNPK